jgi:Ni/Co efflux regulator RcnB
MRTISQSSRFKKDYKREARAGHGDSWITVRGRPDDHGGYVKHDEWHKGAKINQNDWNRGTQVDWHAHHLQSPPRGYEWRQVDGNYVLAAAATGIIAATIIAAGH